MSQSDETWSWANYVPTDSQVVAQSYDDMAPEYNETVNSWRYEGPTVAANLLRRYEVPANAAVLDAGCGTGLTGLALKNAGYTDIIGIDISAQSLPAATATGAYQAVYQQDLQHYPFNFADNQFDVVQCIGVLTYIDPLKPLLHEFHRLTKPGGLIVFSQRDDIYVQRENEHLFATLADSGLWAAVYQSEKLPYLPGHKDYTDKINVYYFVFRVK